MTPTMDPHPRNGARLLVDSLLALGADTAFCVPGESYLPVLDALHDVEDRFRLVTCRQEGGAAFMAEAWGKLTGRPGICFVTRGPGATNASIGVHTARQDSTPMILFIGQVGRPELGREAFQEIDYRQMFGPIAKWATQLEAAARIPEILARAWQVATSGRPGPVVIALPEDVLAEETDASPPRPVATYEPQPDPAALERLGGLLESARAPLMIVGAGGWKPEARAALADFAHRWSLPVAAAFRRQDIFDNAHPCYVGELGTSASPTLAARVRNADLVLAVGARLDEMTTNGYTLIEAPAPRQTLVLVLVHSDPEVLHQTYQPTLAIAAGVNAFATRLGALLPTRTPLPWLDWMHSARAEQERNATPASYPGALDLGAVMRVLAARLPEDTIVCNGAGNYTGWPQRFHCFRHYPSQLAPLSGAMGYGVPAAIAASLREPNRSVLAFAGDGDFLMNGQELATAVQYGARPLILVVNNGMYGTIRMHQERSFPGRTIATTLVNPDLQRLQRPSARTATWLRKRRNSLLRLNVHSQAAGSHCSNCASIQSRSPPAARCPPCAAERAIPLQETTIHGHQGSDRTVRTHHRQLAARHARSTHSDRRHAGCTPCRAGPHAG